ncbi:MAG: flagellar type III secretion system pore protein FliP [Lachnospiraceae bacterium]|nr:flagellar type III secretion system pore protein FliP [Lachnospiraceae bacterium]
MQNRQTEKKRRGKKLTDKNYRKKSRLNVKRLKSVLTAITLRKVICLLVTVGILCIIPAASVNASSTGEGLTGQTGDSTVINPSGTAENQDDLQNLNIVNRIEIEYNNGNGQLNGALRILLILTMIALAPILLICMTCFTRIIIVLHFTRAALNTQTAPPNQVLMGLALFLTFFVMSPTIASIYTNAYLPLDEGRLTQEEAIEAAIQPMRQFMYNSTQKKDVELFMSIARQDWDGNLENIPLPVLIPSYMLSELREAFFFGFLIYIPFIVIDMVVASALMSMGMMMLPPTTISMPFKILLFVMADGWGLIIGELMKTFTR